MVEAVSAGVARIAGLLLLLLMFCGHAVAQGGTPPAAPAHEAAGQPVQVRALLDLLADPAVQDWLRQARETAAPAAPAAVAEPRQNPPASISTSASLAERIARSRAHVREIVAALPHLPARMAEAGDRLAEAVHGSDTEHGGELALLAFALGAAGAFATRRLGSNATRAWQQAHPDPLIRLGRLGLRLLIAALPALAFTAGVLIALMLFEWPPVLKTVVIAYALAVVAILLAYHVLRVLLINPAPQPQPAAEAGSGEEAALAAPAMAGPVNGELAKAVFWHRRLVLFIGWFVLAAATIETLDVLEVPRVSVQACAYLLGLVQLAIGLEAVWRRPAGEVRKQLGKRTVNILLTVLGVVLWWLSAVRFSGLFWLLTFAVVLPVTIKAIDWRVKRLLRPAGGVQAGYAGVLEVCLNRGARLVLVVGAVYWMSQVWHIDLIALTDQTTPLKRLMRGILNAVITLFLADFLWQLIKAAIDARLAQAGPPGAHGEDALVAAGETGIGHGDDPVRQARLRTLLPIFRNILLVVIAVIAILMALSGLGIEIGPLIAGAGVVGVAVGFGSQTLVKDVISGIFYLLDDAFRVGEYIQSGSYKGTVESFSLRSVKLRHHRGPVYTVPFGQLGAVQNMSRDWVMDKFTINVAYDTDLEKARKIIKNIGQQLAEDPEHAANILQPLKMQGVEQFGEYGIQIKCKIMTRPGEQFMIRRMALRQIKQAFDEAGIRFALPQVHVAGNGPAGNGDAATAAAGQIRDSLAAAREREA
ncbi:mechanosensitive ion channel family protein [Pseudochelatococcus lubricantis]|uniref:mechanosensitive ion channel family protein n=1 Tax=Pseudochelatococcus lubricantis TaxID=1538102 RepID=UPI0035E79424